MTDLKLEIVTAENEIAEIDARLTGHERVLMQLRLDKLEGHFVPEEGRMTAAPTYPQHYPPHNPGTATFALPDGTARSGPTMTEAQIDTEIERIEKSIKALRARKTELSSESSSSTTKKS